MGYAFLERPNPNFKQYRETRRGGNQPSGVVVVHTAENVTDLIGADAGAEGVLNFLCNRSDPGSYHVLCDSDSTIYTVPWHMETWHDTRTNPHSVGISGAVASRDWERLGKRGEAIVVRMALAAREYATWLNRTRGITIPARRITQAQAMARVPGFVAHGTMDPGRRSDPGSDFDWNLFLKTFESGAPEVAPELKEDPEDMLLISAPARGYALVGAGYFRGIGNINEVEALKAAGVKENPRLTDLQHDHVREACTLGLYGQDLAKVIREHSTEVELQPIIEAVQASVRETIKATPLETDLDDDDVEAIAVRVGEDFASRVKQ